MSGESLLLQSMSVTSALLCCVFLLAWKALDKPRHAIMWAACYGFGAVQWMAHDIEGAVFGSEGIRLAVIACSSVLVNYFCVAGLLSRAKRNRRWWALPCGMGVCAVVMSLVALSGHNQEWVMVLIPLFAGCMCAYSASIVLDRGANSGLVELVLAALFCLFALSKFIAAGAGINNLVLVSAVGSVSEKVQFLPVTAGYLALGMLTLLLLASDLAHKSEKLAQTDALTGLLNRRGFQLATTGMLARAFRRTDTLSVMVCDLDHFKRVNDTYGHDQGDAVLSAFAAILKQTARETDVLARMGGEEFVVVMPSTEVQGAIRLADRIRRACQSMALVAQEGAPIGVTASFGVAALSAHDTALDDLLKRADQALYCAKADGRNCVRTFQELRVALVELPSDDAAESVYSSSL